MPKKTEPWDRQKGESRQAFEAFSVYVGLGPIDRSLAATGRELGKSTTLMSRWSARWGWVERAEEWDRVGRLREDRAILEEKAREMEELLRSCPPPPEEPKRPLDEVDPSELTRRELLEHLHALWKQEARG
jgi:hypothetical protein